MVVNERDVMAMTAKRKKAIEQKIAQLSALCQRNNLACQYGDLISQCSGLKEKWYSLFKRKKLESIDEEFDKLDKEFERIVDEELLSAILSSCRMAQLSPVQEHGFRVLHAALHMKKSCISNLPDDKAETELRVMDIELGDDLSAMKKVSAGDTEIRRDWFKSFLGIFEHLSLAEGWRLSAMSRFRCSDGRAWFFVTNDNGGFCENPLDKMSVSGDPILGSIEAAMFDFVIAKVYLHGYDPHKEGWVVRDLPTLIQECPQVRFIMSNIAKSEDMREFCDYDFLPTVSLRRENEYWVRYVEYRMSGFYQRVKLVGTSGCIGNIRVSNSACLANCRHFGCPSFII